MENKAIGTPKPFTMQLQAACLCFGVLTLAACGGGRIGDGSAQPYYPPPVVSPPTPAPTPAPTTPFVTLDAIDYLATDTEGQKYVVPGGDIGVATTVTVDGRPSDASDLASGDVALIRGTIYPHDCDGPNCEYTHRANSIDAYHLIVGVAESVDPSHARLVVMGQSVTVSGNTVVNDSVVSDGALATVQPGWMVAVSGFLTASGDVVATRIVRIDSQDGFLLRGLVAATDAAAGRIRIGGLDIDYAQAAINRQDFPNGDPMVGDQVMVRADAGPIGGLLAVRSVTFVPRSLSVDPNTNVTLNGIVTRYGSADDFDVAGVTARLNCVGDDCGSSRQDLSANAAVQLTGVQAADGVVSASQLSTFLGGLPFDLHRLPYIETTLVAPIAAIDAGAGALTVAGFQVQSSAHTRVVDRRGGDTSTLSTEDLKVGDLVSTAGTYGGTPGLLIAESIARVPLQDPQVTTFRFALAEPAITVLGRSILTTDTTRWDRCGIPADAAMLFGGDSYVYYLTIGLPALAAAPLEASSVSIYDGCG